MILGDLSLGLVLRTLAEDRISLIGFMFELGWLGLISLEKICSGLSYVRPDLYVRPIASVGLGRTRDVRARE